MSSEVRKGVSNAHFNEEQSSIFIIEVFVISIVAGLYYSSWWVFGGVLLGLIIGRVYQNPFCATYARFQCVLGLHRLYDRKLF